MFLGPYHTKAGKEEADCYLPKITQLLSHDLLKYL